MEECSHNIEVGDLDSRILESGLGFPVRHGSEGSTIRQLMREGD